VIRVVFILVVVGLILLGVWWALNWLAKNRVRITMHRPPTGREIFWISMALQALRTLLRLLLRR
jgi:hypothetical protein